MEGVSLYHIPIDPLIFSLFSVQIARARFDLEHHLGRNMVNELEGGSMSGS